MSYIDTLLSSYYNEMVVPDGYSGGSEYDVAREEIMSCTDALLNYLNSGAGHAYFGSYEEESEEANAEVGPFGRMDESEEALLDVAEQITEAETLRRETERGESEEEREHLEEISPLKKKHGKKHGKRGKKGGSIDTSNLQETQRCDALAPNPDAQKDCVDGAFDGLERHPPQDYEEVIEHRRPARQANIDMRRELDDQNLAANYWRIKKHVGGVDELTEADMEERKKAIENLLEMDNLTKEIVDPVITNLNAAREPFKGLSDDYLKSLKDWEDQTANQVREKLSGMGNGTRRSLHKNINSALVFHSQNITRTLEERQKLAASPAAATAVDTPAVTPKLFKFDPRVEAFKPQPPAVEAPPVDAPDSDSDEDDNTELLHESVIDETVRKLVTSVLEKVPDDLRRAAHDMNLAIRKEATDKGYDKWQTSQLRSFSNKVFNYLPESMNAADIPEHVSFAINKAKGDQDFEDDLQDEEDDEILYAEAANLRKRKNLLGSVDPGKLAMDEDRKLGASGGGVFSLFHSKS
jgi:hypothetical protein